MAEKLVIIKNYDQLNNIQKLIFSMRERHNTVTGKSDLVLMFQEIIAVPLRILRNAMGLEQLVS